MATSLFRNVARVVGGAVLAATMALSTSCSSAQLGAMQFRQDDRLEIVRPSARARVTLPFDVSWRVRDSVPRRQRFAVFIDRSPMRVGHDLKALAAGDVSCERDPRCPDAEYLAAKGVYVTTARTLHITALPRVGGVGDEQHVLTVVLLDEDGSRRVESSWYVDFRLRRRN